jgi:16S rRNA (guanine1207-N2)-methyltransferase
MTSWARDPDAAADALIGRSLDSLPLAGRILLANPSGGLPAMLSERGIAFVRWERRLKEGASAQPWPPAGPFELGLLRLAKAKDEQDMACHAVLSVLATGAWLIVYGGNDEGIRSAAAALGSLCGTVDTIASRGHGRVIAGRRPPSIEGLGQDLAHWRRLNKLSIDGQIRDWVSYPGLFAADRIDDGTAFFLATLPALPPTVRTCDFGCGSGVIGAVLARRAHGLVDMIDNDSVALIAAQENVPAGRTRLGSSLGCTGRPDYDLILSNPPLHEGLRENHTALHQLIREAPAHLAPGGSLKIVLQRRVPIAELLATHLSEVRVVAENGRYRVWSARRR